MKLFKTFKSIFNQSGQGLVSVLIAAGAGSIILGFIADMMLGPTCEVARSFGQRFPHYFA